MRTTPVFTYRQVETGPLVIRWSQENGLVASTVEREGIRQIAPMEIANQLFPHAMDVICDDLPEVCGYMIRPLIQGLPDDVVAVRFMDRPAYSVRPRHGSALYERLRTSKPALFEERVMELIM